MHYTGNISSLSIEKIIKYKSNAIELSKLKEVAGNKGFEKVSDDNFYNEIEFSKEIDGWILSLFSNRFEITSKGPEVLIVSLFHKNHNPNVSDKSKDISKISQKFKKFIFRVDIMGTSKIWDNKKISPESNDICQDIINSFKDIPDSKKLNINEILKDLEYSVSTDIIKLPFSDEYGWFSYYPFLLINGSFNILKVQTNLTKMRANLKNNQGRYIEVSIINPTLDKWNNLKKDLINGLKVII